MGVSLQFPLFSYPVVVACEGKSHPGKQCSYALQVVWIQRLSSCLLSFCFSWGKGSLTFLPSSTQWGVKEGRRRKRQEERKWKKSLKPRYPPAAGRWNQFPSRSPPPHVIFDIPWARAKEEEVFALNRHVFQAGEDANSNGDHQALCDSQLCHGFKPPLVCWDRSCTFIFQ